MAEEKIEIGEYIRNKFGIAKVINISYNKTWGVEELELDGEIVFMVNRQSGKISEKLYRFLPLTEDIDISKINHSKNIIDLIEVRRLCE